MHAEINIKKFSFLIGSKLYLQVQQKDIIHHKTKQLLLNEDACMQQQKQQQQQADQWSVGASSGVETL